MKHIRLFRFTHDALVYVAGSIPIALLFARSAADIFLTALAIFFIIRCVRVRDAAWLRNPVYGVLMALWVYMACSGLLGADMKHSLLLVFIHLRFPLFFIAMDYWILRDEKDIRYFTWFLGLAILYMGIDTGIQWSTGNSLFHQRSVDGRLSGALTTLNAGNYLARLWFQAFGLMLWLAWPQGRRNLRFVVPGALIIAPWILLSGERSATLLFVLSVCTASVFICCFIPKARKWVAPCIGLFLAAVALLSWANPFLHSRALLMKQQLHAFGATAYGQLWKASLLLWQRMPLTGLGLGNFRKICPELLPSGNVSYCDIHPHNYYLEWLVDTGLIGLGFYIAFITLLLRAFVRQDFKRMEAAVLGACVAGAYMMAFFPFSVSQGFFSNWAGVLFWFSLASTGALVKAIRYRNASASDRSRITASA